MQKRVHTRQIREGMDKQTVFVDRLLSEILGEFYGAEVMQYLQAKMPR